MYVDPALTRTVVRGFVRKTSGKRLSREGELSEREPEVVRLTGAGHSSNALAAKLGLRFKTVETYRARSLEKLGLPIRADLVRYAVQRGWRQGE